MGTYMREEDIYIGSFLDLLNLRFAPPQEGDKEYNGGIQEMTELQRRFDIFQEGRRFVDSARILNLGGLLNNRAKNRWFELLQHLSDAGSNRPGQNGDQAIVSALISNFKPKMREQPLPVYFKTHDLRQVPGHNVIIDTEAKPINYLDLTYLTISLPMKPWEK